MGLVSRQPERVNRARDLEMDAGPKIVVNEGRASRSVLPLHGDPPKRLRLIAQRERSHDRVVARKSAILAAEAQFNVTSRFRHRERRAVGCADPELRDAIIQRASGKHDGVEIFLRHLLPLGAAELSRSWFSLSLPGVTKDWLGRLCSV